MTEWSRFLSPARPIGRVVRFSAIGALTTTSYFVLTNLVVTLGMDAKTASVVIYLLLMPISFLGHRRLTFASRGRAAPEWLKFCLVHAINLIGVYVLSWFAIDRNGLPPWLAFMFISIAAPGVNFIAFHLWVFSHRNAEINHDVV